MRAWFAVPALLCAVLPAFAQEAQTESLADVEFEAEQILFRGTDFVFRFPQGQPLGIEVRADVSADASGTMDGQSKMVWPEAMTQGWLGEAGGGELTVDLRLDLSLSAVVDGVIEIAGFNLDFTTNPIRYTAWTDAFSWSVTKFFDTFLLPGSPMQNVTLFLDGTTGAPAYQWSLGSTEQHLGYVGLTGCEYYLEIGGTIEVEPESRVTLTGEQIITRGRAVDTYDGTVVVPPPNTNDGTAEFESLWQGEVTSDFALNLDLDPSVTLWCEEADGNRVVSQASSIIQSLAQGALGTLYQWDIAEDTRPFQSKNTPYVHDLPAIATSDSRLDFGAVLVGQDAQLNLVIEDLGDIDLTGDITVTGDAVFTISRPDIDIDGGADATYTITFNPSASGEFEGELVLASNDPVNDEVVIPMTGRGFEEGEDTAGVDTGPVEPGRRGCGCDAGTVAPLAGWSLLGLPILLGLRRRR